MLLPRALKAPAGCFAIHYGSVSVFAWTGLPAAIRLRVTSLLLDPTSRRSKFTYEPERLVPGW
jgi:hypothetical protein